MKKKVICTILITVIGAIFIFVIFYMPVKYVPVILVFSPDHHYENISKYEEDTVFINAVQSILDEYDEWYYRTDKAIYVHYKLARNKEIIANYTAKALDSCGYQIDNE